MKTTSAEHVLPMFCACGFHGNFMNNFLSYCGLVDARISASEKNLPLFKKKTISLKRVDFWPKFLLFGTLTAY